MLNEATKTNIVQFIETATKWVALVVLLANLWLAAKLAPLAQNIELVTQRVSASENQIKIYSQDHTDIQLIKQSVLQTSQDIKDIKGYLNLRISVTP